MPILQHDGAPVNPQLSTSEFLLANPLPPDLAHLEETIKSLPNVEVLLDTVLGCFAAGFTNDQIEKALRYVVEYNRQPAKRCACCLHWRTGGRTFAKAGRGVIELATVCPQCEQLIEAGRITRRMRRNLREYLGVAR